MHAILRVEHDFCNIRSFGCLIKPFEQRHVETERFGMLLGGGSQLNVVANEDDFFAFFDKRHDCFWLSLLGGFVNDDIREAFVS